MLLRWFPYGSAAASAPAATIVHLTKDSSNLPLYILMQLLVQVLQTIPAQSEINCFQGNTVLTGIKSLNTLQLDLAPLAEKSEICKAFQGQDTSVVLWYNCQNAWTFTSATFLLNLSAPFSVSFNVTAAQYSALELCSSANFNFTFMNKLPITGAVHILQSKTLDASQCWSKVIFNYSMLMQFFNVTTKVLNCQINPDAVAYLEYDEGDGNYQQLRITPAPFMLNYNLPYSYATMPYFYQDASMYQNQSDVVALKTFLQLMHDDRFMNIKIKLVTKNSGINAIYYATVEQMFGYGSEKFLPSTVQLSPGVTTWYIPSAKTMALYRRDCERLVVDVILDGILESQDLELNQFIKFGMLRLEYSSNATTYQTYVTCFINGSVVDEISFNGTTQPTVLKGGEVRVYHNKVCLIHKLKQVYSPAKTFPVTLYAIEMDSKFDFIEYFRMAYTFNTDQPNICLTQADEVNTYNSSFNSRIHTFIQRYWALHRNYTAIKMGGAHEVYMYELVGAYDYFFVFRWMIPIALGLAAIVTVIVVRMVIEMNGPSH